MDARGKFREHEKSVSFWLFYRFRVFNTTTGEYNFKDVRLVESSDASYEGSISV